MLKDKSYEFKHLWPGLERDGHPSYSPDNSLVVTDTYPDRARISSVYCMAENADPRVIAKIFTPFRYDNDVRCDLHPRWSRDGERICMDAIIMNKKRLTSLKNILGVGLAMKKVCVLLSTYNGEKIPSRAD